MILFTFIYEEDPRNGHNNRIEIDEDLFKRIGNDDMTDADDRIVLEGVLSLLSEEEREIVILYAVTGMKHKEIAESLGLNLSTTLSKYYRALKKLRKYLEGGGQRHE